MRSTPAVSQLLSGHLLVVGGSSRKKCGSMTREKRNVSRKSRSFDSQAYCKCRRNSNKAGIAKSECLCQCCTRMNQDALGKGVKK